MWVVRLRKRLKECVASSGSNPFHNHRSNLQSFVCEVEKSDSNLPTNDLTLKVLSENVSSPNSNPSLTDSNCGCVTGGLVLVSTKPNVAGNQSSCETKRSNSSRG